LILLITLTILAVGFVSSLSVEESFKSWTTLNRKSYHSKQEYEYRLSVYKFNLDYVENHNRQNLGFTLAMNQFADLTSKEFGKLYLSTVINSTNKPKTNEIYTHNPLDEMANDVDWRTKRAVTGIKNQGQCGSCWAFATTCAIEGAWAIKYGKLVSLSEQNLVDCSSSFGNQGCNGGEMDYAYLYVIANKGIDTEYSYPYTAQDGTCVFNKATIGALISNYKDIDADEKSLQSAVFNIGPIACAVDAAHTSFQMYSSGIYYEPSCSSTQLDHGVNVVGYGSENGKDYYIVKNMWGTSWGMQGYIWMARNKFDNCGIATDASYPLGCFACKHN